MVEIETQNIKRNLILICVVHFILSKRCHIIGVGILNISAALKILNFGFVDTIASFIKKCVFMSHKQNICLVLKDQHTKVQSFYELFKK